MRWRGSSIAAAVCVWFFLVGQLFVPLLGIEDDEALFGMAFFQPRYAASVQVGHSTLPLMLMTYLGTLKAWIYRPILKWFHPGVWSLRVPALMAGALSIWLFYLLLKRMSGERAAVIGCLLLAADPLYLLTTCFDWGPVALQHLLLIAGMLLLLSFYQQGGNGKLAAAGFLLGLALWDKAIGVWMLSGLGIAALALFWREVWRVITVRRVAIFAVALLAGTLPLWVYNIQYDWATFHGNFRKDFSQIRGKAGMLIATSDGRGLFGYLTDENWQTPAPHQPSGPLQRASWRLSAMTGESRRTLAPYAFLLAVLLIPLAGANDRRAVLFALIAMIVAWFQMAITADAGASVHHAILIWPLPQVVMGISLAALSKRFGKAGLASACAVVCAVMASEALVTNEYYTQMARNGGSQSWSDAIFRLHDHLRNAPAETVVCMDWGIMDNLRFMSAGKLPLVGTDDRVEDPAIVRAIASNPANLYVAHTREQQFFPANEKFLKTAGSLGFRRDVVAVIDDSFGRRTYELYRLSPSSQ